MSLQTYCCLRRNPCRANDDTDEALPLRTIETESTFPRLSTTNHVLQRTKLRAHTGVLLKGRPLKSLVPNDLFSIPEHTWHEPNHRKNECPTLSGFKPSSKAEAQHCEIALKAILAK
jgi:hypothetical protein